MRQAQRLDHTADSLRDTGDALGRRIRQQHREFLAAMLRGEIGRATGLEGDGGGNAAQAVIPRRMAVAVVE